MKNLFFILCFTILISLISYAQKDTVLVPDTYDAGGTEGTLNTAVQPYIDDGTISNTVFKLKPYGLYVLTGTITTKAGQVFELYADPAGNTQETAPPMIAWTEDTSPDKTYLFDVPGELKMKNIWLLWAGVNGTRFASTIRIGDSSGTTGGRIEANNVIFDYVDQGSSGAVTPYATHFKGSFENCYFRNCTDNHLRYYSRAVSFAYNTTGLHIDSLSFENCTFANIGYVYMQEGGEYGDNVFFNHCTFYNVLMYPLESGWWWKMYVTNSLFVNTQALGRIPLTDNEGPGGTISIAPIDSGALGNGFGFSVPFTEQDRHILFSNNNYYIEQWLIDWMHNNPYSLDLHKTRHDDEIPQPMSAINSTTKTFFDSTDADSKKVFPYMNLANLDSVELGFVNPPINLDSMKNFIYHKWYDNGDGNWSWHPEYSYAEQKWPKVEDLSYPNSTLQTAAMGGFPLGDLNWFPTQYASWAAQADVEHSRITTWLETGSDPGAVGVKEIKSSLPSVYKLSQNYPNPFNPTTNITYSVPQSGQVSLKVFNTLGQEVATIFNGYQAAGNYAAIFDGSKLTSGVYFYRLQSDNVSITKKFILMK